MNRTTALFIDDERFPVDAKNYDWIIQRSSVESIKWLDTNGCPAFISFDHDLSGDDKATRVVQWMVERDMDMDGKFIPENFDFFVHSQNPIGAENIVGLLRGYLEQRDAPSEVKRSPRTPRR